jgi:hypothetical protein
VQQSRRPAVAEHSQHAGRAWGKQPARSSTKGHGACLGALLGGCCRCLYDTCCCRRRCCCCCCCCRCCCVRCPA